MGIPTSHDSTFKKLLLGKFSSGRTPCPVGLVVLNANQMTASAFHLLGYMPHVPRNIHDRIGAEHKIRQVCIKAIINRIDAVHRTGFTLNMRMAPTKPPATLCLQPFLCCIQLDSKERHLFEGKRSERACMWCRWRKGTSAFGIRSPHNLPAIAELMRQRGTPGRDRASQKVRKRAIERLERWGFSRHRTCIIHDMVSYRCLLPGPSPKVPLRGITAVDVLHGVKIMMSQYIMNEVRNGVGTGRTKEVLDNVIQDFVLRHPITGAKLRRQSSLLGEQGLTGEKRVLLLFLLPIALGQKAAILGLPDEVSEALLQSIASAQIILMAISGKREYTETELDDIFIGQGRLMWAGLEKVHDHLDEEVLYRYWCLNAVQLDIFARKNTNCTRAGPPYP